MSSAEIFWLTVGFGAQAMFTARFLVQWLASEKKGESVVPVSFWYLSIVGGWGLLAYAIYRRDPVIILGQALGVVVYSRNLMLIYRKKPAERGSRPNVPVVDPSEQETISIERPVRKAA